MKRSILMGALLVLVAVGSAHASSMNYAWNSCLPEGGVSSKAFACNTNSGLNSSVASFIPSVPRQLVAIYCDIYIQSASASIEDWWQYQNAGTCRQTAASVSQNFISFPGSICADPWSNNAVSALGSYVVPSPDFVTGPNSAKLIGLAALASPGVAIVPGQEYYGLIVRFSNAKTVGTGACAGCATPVSLVLGKIELYEDGNNNVAETITTPAQSVCIDWQGGSGLCSATPAKNRTWGAIKSLYR